MASSVMLSSFRATLICKRKPLALQFLPHTRRIPSLPRYRSFLLHASPSLSYSSSAAAVEEPLPPPLSCSPNKYCSWPEWTSFVDRLNSRGYLVPSNSIDNRDEFYKDMNVLKTACLSFARDRFDIFESLSKDTVQALVEKGCININRKVVNSSKRLRAYTGVEESDACGVCALKSTCDRAYLKLQTSESGARTADIVRILLFYAIEQPKKSRGVQSAATEQAQLSARRLLAELVELSEKPRDPWITMPSVYGDEKDSAPTKKKDRSKHKDQVEMKEGDWICPECTFMNFSRNKRCQKCCEPGPKRDDKTDDEIEKKVTSKSNKPAELKEGDWNCTKCNFMNFGRNMTCRKCSEARPDTTKAEIKKKVLFTYNDQGELKGGDWICTKCKFVNFGRNMTCIKCNEARPVKVEKTKAEIKPGTCNARKVFRSSRYNKSEQDDDKAEPERGDWKCNVCDFTNFGKNLICIRCESDGPEKVKMSNVELKKGDWICSQCNYMNYANNKKCYRCTGLRPPRQLNPGEWECPSCDYVNFRGNDACKKCEHERPKAKADIKG